MDKLEVAKEAAKLYFDFNCTAEQAIQTAINLYSSKEEQEKVIQENYNKFKERVEGDKEI